MGKQVIYREWRRARLCGSTVHRKRRSQLIYSYHSSVIHFANHPHRRLRLVRIFKGNDELVLEQSGAAPGTKAKDAGLEVEDSEMQE